MNTIIEKIKAEVEWLKTTSISEESVSQDDNYYEGRISVCDDILNFLDTLLCEELEEAAKNYFDKNWGEGSWDIRDQVIEDFKAGAFWQKEQMMDEWLKDRDGCFWDGVNEGKKSMKEQMMKEAVEAKIYGYDDGSFELVASWLDMPKESKFKDGDKVCIVIVKEEGK